jgi:hypothetical protein
MWVPNSTSVILVVHWVSWDVTHCRIIIFADVSEECSVSFFRVISYAELGLLNLKTETPVFFLCFVDLASLYNLVNKVNFVNNFFLVQGVS